nr:hypothetical protein [Tanacetum cinerariifolium]
MHSPSCITITTTTTTSTHATSKRLCLSTLASREVGYGIRDTWVDPTETVPEIAPMTMGEVNTRVTDLVELHEHDTQELYALFEDAQDSRTRISQRVAMDSQRVDLLMEDKIAHPKTIQIVKDEAYVAREAWAYSIGLSQAVHFELQTHQEQASGIDDRDSPSNGRHEMRDGRHVGRVVSTVGTEGVVSLTRWIKKIESVVVLLKIRLLDNIYGSMKALKPKTLDETIELANDLMHQKLRTYAERVYNMGTGKRKLYSGNLPKGTMRQNPQGSGCFECGATRHFKRDRPKLKNKDGEKVNAPGWVYADGNAEKKGNASRDLDSNVITGTFLLNNRYADILFDTGADRSFISTAFSSLIDIVPTPLGNSYDVELADGKIVGVDIIMRGYTLNFLGHLFNIDLMPVELGSFDVIIGMDWLRRCHDVIVCDEKLVQIPYGNETLTFRGNESNNGRESRLTVILCSKA